jgi:hypothetical protein
LKVEPVFSCFTGHVDSDKLDRSPFKFQHQLLGHPALSLENLARVIPALPEDRVMYSRGLLAEGADFEGTYRHRPVDRTLEQTIENIRTSDSYIMVRSPECDPTFAELHRQLLGDVEQIMKVRGVGSKTFGAQLYLFIASPNVSVRQSHLEPSTVLGHRVHDEDNAHHGERGDRPAPQAALLPTRT